jgi:hypothetical protein
MAAPAPRQGQAAAAQVDPVSRSEPVRTLAHERSLAVHRARRRARIEHELEQRRARLRFWTLVAALLLTGLFLSLTIREQIQTLFGL